MKKQIKMRVVDWWEEDTKQNFYNNFFIQLLLEKYDVIYSSKPDFLLYGPFGYEHLKYDCVRIFYTGENVRTNWDMADYGIDFDFLDFGDRHLRLPLAFIPSKSDQERYTKYENLRATPKNRDKFCAFMASNGGSHHTIMRDRFFEILSSHKKVDSGGRYKNNIGGTIGDRYGDFRTSKIEWLQDYRFNICFENSSYPGYLTEKLIDAYLGGCIPIYWGDTSLRESKTQLGGGQTTSIIENPSITDKTSILEKHQIATKTSQINMRIPTISPHLRDYSINPKALINAHNFLTLDDLAQEVMRIDNDKSAYEAMRQEPLILGDFNPFGFYRTKLVDFLDSIILQNPSDALRRGSAQHIDKIQRILARGSNPKVYLKMKIKNKIANFMGKFGI